jgi:hypothetical protein
MDDLVSMSMIGRPRTERQKRVANCPPNEWPGIRGVERRNATGGARRVLSRSAAENEGRTIILRESGEIGSHPPAEDSQQRVHPLMGLRSASESRA